jgi:hypothetical protein
MFTPKIKITNVNPLGASFTVEDITGFYPVNPTGYSQPGLAPDIDYALYRELYIQKLGELPVLTPLVDSIALTHNISHILTDGVFKIIMYFISPFDSTTPLGAVGYTLSGDTMTKTDDKPWIGVGGLFEGAVGLIRPTDPISTMYPIKSVTNDTIIITGNFTTSYEVLVPVYKAIDYVVVSTSGETKLMQEIGNMALSEFNNCGCDGKTANALCNKLALKEAIKIFTDCENWSKAHDAAILLDNLTLNIEPCGC